MFLDMSAKSSMLYWATHDSTLLMAGSNGADVSGSCASGARSGELGGTWIIGSICTWVHNQEIRDIAIDEQRKCLCDPLDQIILGSDANRNKEGSLECVVLVLSATATISQNSEYILRRVVSSH